MMKMMMWMALLSVASTAHAVEVVKNGAGVAAGGFSTVRATGAAPGLTAVAVTGDVWPGSGAGAGAGSFATLADPGPESVSGQAVAPDAALVATPELAGSLLLLVGALALWSVTGGGRAGTPRLSS